MAVSSSSAPVSGGGAISQVEKICMSVASAIPVPHFKKWVSAYFHPVEALESDKANAGAGGVVVNAALAGLLGGIAAAISMVIMAVFSPFMYSGGLASVAVAAVVAVVIYPIIMVIAAFIGSAIYFILAKIFGGKGGYMVQTYGLTLVMGGSLFISFPLMALSPIPCVGFVLYLASMVVGLYALYGYYRVIKSLHALSTGKAAAVIIIPILIAIAIAFVLAIVATAMLAAMLGSVAAGTAAYPAY